MELKDLSKKYNGRIRERKQRLRDFWDGKDIGRPPLSFIPYGSTPRQIFDDFGLQVKRASLYFEKMMELPGDTMPIFWPDMGTVSLASVFGGEVIRESSGQNIWIKPAFDSLEDIRNLELPDAMSGLVKEEFDRCRRWRDLTGGFGYIAPPDMQGPAGNAILAVKQEDFFVGMYTEPELVHKLLRLCTDIILTVLEIYRKEFGDAFVPVTWPHIWLPEGRGITLTQDSLPLLSPKLYREFELPYVQEISRKTGGVFMHCCGQFEHNLNEVKDISVLLGIDQSYPFSRIEKIAEVIGKNLVITPGLNVKGYEEYPSYERYVSRLLSNLPGNVKLWYIFASDDPDNPCFSPDDVTATLKLLGLSNIADEYWAVVKRY
ncbi:MAG: hypothetical protein JW957_08095 [Candidatus Omnitrophica bacterium]|nr:hypothetical protein [Candidatus Omnitrophota bacterium]